MKTFLVILCLLGSLTGYSQEMSANGDRNSVTVTWKEKKVCKHLFFQKKSVRCNKPILYYTAIYSCNGKKIKASKKPRINFKDEIPMMHRMMDSVKQFMLIDLCMLSIRPEEYDDIMIRFIDRFGRNEEWKKSLERRGMKDGKPNFDEALITKIIRDEFILDPVDEFLNHYGFRVAITQVKESEITQVSKAELKRLGKDENLVIPLPSPIWIQVSQTPK